MNGSCTGEDGKLPVRNLVYLHVEGTFYLYPEPGEDCPGGEITEKMTQHIKEQCCQCLPMGVMPEFALIPDSMEQYFMGLGQSALDLLDNQIRLH